MSETNTNAAQTQATDPGAPQPQSTTVDEPSERSIAERIAERSAAKRYEREVEARYAERERAIASESAALEAQRKELAESIKLANEYRGRFEALAKNPRAAAEALGWSREQLASFAEGALEESDPHRRAVAQLREGLAERDERIKALQERLDRFEGGLKEREEQARAEARERAEQEAQGRFFREICSPEKAPALHAEMARAAKLVGAADAKALIVQRVESVMRDAMAQGWRPASGRVTVDDVALVVQHLEQEAASLRASQGEAAKTGEASPETSGEASQAQARRPQATQTVGAARASERRTAEPTPARSAGESWSKRRARVIAEMQARKVEK